MSNPVALIFDFGNVIAFFDYGRATEAIGARVGLRGEELLAKLRERGLTPLVIRYESGQIDDRQFHRELNELAELDLSFDEFVPAWSDIFRLNESAASLIEPLKRNGYTLVLGSNTNALHTVQFRSQFEKTLSHFDALVLSYEVGHVKPSREFYLACALAAGRAPAECVFIDDLPENVEGAKAAGLQGIVYRDTAGLVDSLRSLGVEIGD